MGRSNAAVAAQTKAAILAARAADPRAGYGAIAKLYNVSRAYVQKVLNGSVAAPSSSDLLLSVLRDQALSLRVELNALGRVAGPFELISQLCSPRFGYDQRDLPCHATFDRWIAGAGLALPRVAVNNPANKAYWTELRPTRHGERALVDTAIVNVCGVNYVLILMNDWHSRVAHAEIVPMHFVSYLPWFFGRYAAAAGGMPHTIQSDNGMGFFSAQYKSYSKAQIYVNQQGCKRWEFVPVAEAIRNGKVERLVQTVKDAMLGAHTAHAFTDLDGARDWLSSWFHHFNAERFHAGLSSRRKGGYRSPSDVGVFAPLSAEVPKQIAVMGRVSADFLVSYKRYVASGVAHIAAPSMLVFVSPGLTGHYVDVIVKSDGSGFVQWAELVSEVAFDGKRVYKRVAVHTVANFAQVGAAIFCSVDPALADRFAPIHFDEHARLRSMYAHLKSKKPLPGWVLPGVARVDLVGGFQLVDQFSGDVLFDSTICNDVDHYRDFAG